MSSKEVKSDWTANPLPILQITGRRSENTGRSGSISYLGLSQG
jgi:hypothetical protein